MPSILMMLSEIFINLLPSAGAIQQYGLILVIVMVDYNSGYNVPFSSNI